MSNQEANRETTAREYRVQVGLAAVVVKARDVAEAVVEARKRFCQEMPRLWDLIHGMEESRFQVMAVER